MEIKVYKFRNQMTSQQEVGKRKTRSVSSFLKKTYQILQNPDNHYAVQWAHDGVGFVVIKQQEFSKQILPIYFKHSNYSSFVRQLNMYNFYKIRESNSESHFHHQYFRQNDKLLLSQIKRKPQKKKRKYEQSQDDGKSDISVKKQIKLNSNKTYCKQNQIVQIKSWRQEEKKGFEDTRHAFVSQKQQKQNSNQRISIQNILSIQNDEDKISINNQLVDRFPRYPTKQIFCPSNNNIYPFPFKGTLSHFTLFF